MSQNSVTFLVLGSNLGNRTQNLEAARKLLALSMQILKVSNIYESEPMAGLSQPNYLNQAIAVKEDLLPEDLLHLIKDIEFTLGRKPAASWASRIIDIDIIFKGQLQYATPNLQIPHAGYARRDFILRPIADIAPTLVPPGQDLTIAKLLLTSTQHILEE